MAGQQGTEGTGCRMQLPALPPDIEFGWLPETAEGFRFSFEVKRAALGPCIRERWGWDEGVQRRIHEARLAEKPFFEIRRAGEAVGTVSVLQQADHIRFGEFYLWPAQQGQGLGTRILRHCLSLADAQALPVRLEYLKWNPVGSLYRRHGFVVIGESEIHWFMERQASAKM
jgi:GNAT superfamily N-acetyltransferase